MTKTKPQKQKDLVLHRLRAGLTQKQVARLLGHVDTARVSKYENGRLLPPLVTALQLEIVYRTPVAFLFHDMYAALRDEIRSQEEALRIPRQTALF